MATQPRIPTKPGKPQLVPHGRRTAARNPILLVLLAVVAGVLLVGTLLYFFARRAPQPPRPPASAEDVLPEANNDELRVDGGSIGNDTPGKAVTLAGNVTNTGKRTFKGAVVEMVFHDQQGKAIATKTQPIWGLSDGRCEVADEFAAHPIKPNELRFFCVAVDQVPSGWNHELPEMQVVTVTSE